MNFGVLLRRWRAVRRVSQLDLALDADISTRHLSCVETGRAQPSREMVLRLAEALEVPLRERNALLLAAGYAPLYPHTGLDKPEVEAARRAVEFLMAQLEPYPVVVVDRYWNTLRMNSGAKRFLACFPGCDSGTPHNGVRLVFHPQGLRPFIVNWEATAATFIQWLQRDLLRAGDAETRRLLDELLSYPDVPRQWRALDLDASTAPFLAMELCRGDVRLSFFTMLASLGTPYDITLHELRIECFFPADEATEEALRRLAAATSS